MGFGFGSITHGLSRAAHHVTHTVTHNPISRAGSHFGGGLFGRASHFGGGIFSGAKHFITHNPISSTIGNIFHSGNQLIGGVGNLGQGVGKLFSSPIMLVVLAGAGVFVFLQMRK